VGASEPAAAPDLSARSDLARGAGAAPADAAGPRRVRTIADVAALLKAGRAEDALKGLRRMRRRHPKNAYIPFLLGKLYFERRWWSEGIKAYRAALKLDPAYTRRRRINDDLIDALGSPKTAAEARALLVKTIGAPARPHLRRASKTHQVKEVRKQCAVLLRHIR
jgi:predicted Zn-dependent protease